MTRLYCLVLALAFLAPLRAQDAQQQPYTLQACIDHALQNNASIINANIDVKVAEARVGEIRAIGLPQVNGQVQIIDNYKIQTAFLPAIFFAEDPINNPPPVDAPPIGVQFGARFLGDASVTLSQLVFDGTYFLGLKAADVYTDLATKGVEVKKADLASNITKAYYTALVMQERMGILKETYERIGQLLKETKAFYESGFVEELDVDRLTVMQTNLGNEITRMERFWEASMNMLKFQMGMDLATDLKLADRLADIQLAPALIDQAGADPSARPEYALMQTQRQLDQMNVRQYQLGYYPSVAAFFKAGFNSGSNTFQQYKLNDDTWFRYGSMGLSVNIPIFDGLRKRYQIQQAKLNLQKTETNIKALELGISLEQRNAQLTLNSSLQALGAQVLNKELAMKVVEKTKIKYREGVGASQEVINAENELSNALNAYYTALYEALIAKADYQRAIGKQ